MANAETVVGMTQPSLLFDLPASRPRKRGQVTRTSVEAGRAVNRDGRVNDVLTELGAYGIEYCHAPTSAELAGFKQFGGRAKLSGLGVLLTVRRGLSDALAAGFVEHAGERTCAVSGRTCVTWKVRTR